MQPEKIKDLQPHDRRRRREDDPLSEKEKTQVRALCGACLWLGTQTMPQILAKTAEVQSQIPTGAVALFREVAVLVKRVKECATDGLRSLAHERPVLSVGTTPRGPADPTAHHREVG